MRLLSASKVFLVLELVVVTSYVSNAQDNYTYSTQDSATDTQEGEEEVEKRLLPQSPFLFPPCLPPLPGFPPSVACTGRGTRRDYDSPPGGYFSPPPPPPRQPHFEHRPRPRGETFVPSDSRRESVVFPSEPANGFCQSPLGFPGRCIPYRECRFLFNDEFLARRSLCGFERRVSLVCCPQTSQQPGLGGFPGVPFPSQNFNPFGNNGGFGRPHFGNGFGHTRDPYGGGGGYGNGYGTTRNPYINGGGHGRPRRPHVRPFYPSSTTYYPHSTPSTRPQHTRPVSISNRPQRGSEGRWGQKNCGVSNAALVRIVGGRESNLGAWPWIALLFIDVHETGIRSPLCGGALITPQHVITAAHCTFSGNRSLGPEAFIARMGEHDYLSDDDGASPVDAEVVEVMRHRNFNPKTYLNDIAILRLRRPVPLGNGIGLICLPYGRLQHDSYLNKTANIAGWGELYYGGPSSASLQDTRIPVQSLDTCKESFKRTSITFTDNYLCAGSLAGDKDACRGDSGGPLMLLDSQQRFTIIGITSFGRRCAEPGYPGVYARVAKYLDWISQRID